MTAGHFAPLGDGNFYTLKVTKRQYFNTLFLERPDTPDVDLLLKFRIVPTGRNI